MFTIRISPSRTLYIEEGKLQLESSRYVGAVEIREDGLYADGKLVVFRRALRCPVKIGGLYLCGGPLEVPRYFYREVFLEGLGERLRVAELYATDRLNAGDCLAEHLYTLVKGAPHLWDIYYGKQPRPPARCRDLADLQIARGERQHRAFRPPVFPREVAALLGLLRFSEALDLLDRSWRGFAVAMRYGIYSALRWKLDLAEESWLLLFGIYSALDPVVVPRGVAVDLGILRAVPYLVARVLGRWLVALNVAGLRLAAGNFNVMTDGGRKRDVYASCDGAKCVVGKFMFNICEEVECGVVRTWDFEFKGVVKCRDWGAPFFAVEPCQ